MAEEPELPTFRITAFACLDDGRLVLEVTTGRVGTDVLDRIQLMMHGEEPVSITPAPDSGNPIKIRRRRAKTPGRR